jgi:hypothetical protein
MDLPVLILYGSQTGNAQVSNSSLHLLSPHRSAGCLACGPSCTLPSPHHALLPPLTLPKDVAERMAREAQLLLFSPRLAAMDSFDIARLPSEPLIIFVVATAGQVCASPPRTPLPPTPPMQNTMQAIPRSPPPQMHMPCTQLLTHRASFRTMRGPSGGSYSARASLQTLSRG